MKQSFLLLFACMAVSAHAQLRVISNGNIGIGANATQPTSQLCINTNGYSNYASYMTHTDNVLRCIRYGTPSSGTTGVAVDACTKLANINWGYGVRSIVTDENPISYGAAFGVLGSAGNAGNGRNYGILGKITGTRYGAGIYGTSNESDSGITLDARYAGYFNGNVKVAGDLTVTGNINGIVLSPSATGSSEAYAFQNNDRGTDSNVTNLFHELQVRTFQTETPQARMCVSLPEGPEEQSGNSTEKETYFEFQPSEMEKQIASKRHYGLSAEELEAAFPDLVYENEDGTKSINYVEMVPILVQAIKELNTKIEVLEGEQSDAKKSKGVSTGIDESTEVQMLSMGQNRPNPFGTNTNIEICVPADVQNAFIYIYDLQGKKVQQVDVTARGRQNITIQAASLSEGMYLYSLIADGKIVETRRMIVEK